MHSVVKLHPTANFMILCFIFSVLKNIIPPDYKKKEITLENMVSGYKEFRLLELEL